MGHACLLLLVLGWDKYLIGPFVNDSSISSAGRDEPSLPRRGATIISGTLAECTSGPRDGCTYVVNRQVLKNNKGFINFTYAKKSHPHIRVAERCACNYPQQSLSLIHHPAHLTFVSKKIKGRAAAINGQWSALVCSGLHLDGHKDGSVMDRVSGCSSHSSTLHPQAYYFYAQEALPREFY